MKKENKMKAVVFVDVQKDFIDGALKNDKAIEVTPKIVEFAKECVRQGYKLYATRDTHEKTVRESSDFHEELDPVTLKTISKTITGYKVIGGYLTTLEGKKLPVEHCIEGTDGWMIDERLMDVILGKATFVNKPTFGSYDLVDIMWEDFKDELPEEIVICGFCTSICVAANAILLRAKFPNTKITVMKDICACITEESHNAALNVLNMQQIDIK